MDMFTMQANFPLLSEDEQQILTANLPYMKMAELKKAALLFSLPTTSHKADLIATIMLFIQTGHVRKIPTIPARSRAAYHPIQPLAPTSLMLYGEYKNDAKTRAFFKELVGPWFHFTAYGIDWLRNRWLHGEPPTYQEFAQYWRSEYEQRLKQKHKPKDEWMFIRFMQQMKQENPHVTNSYVIDEWKKEQKRRAQHAFALLQKAHEKAHYAIAH